MFIYHHQQRTKLSMKLVYFEGYIPKQDACRREHQLKLPKQGLRRLKERLSHALLV